MKKSIQLHLRTTLVAIFIMFSLTISCQQQAVETITEKQVNILNDRVLAIWNEGDLALADEIYTPDCVRHDCGSPEDIEGLEAMKKFFSSFRSAFPDLNMSIDEIIFKGDKIVWWWTMEGTNLGSMGGLPPTSKEVHLTGVSIASVVNGKMAEIWDYYNQATLFQQMGFTIASPQGQE